MQDQEFIRQNQDQRRNIWTSEKLAEVNFKPAPSISERGVLELISFPCVAGMPNRGSTEVGHSNDEVRLKEMAYMAAIPDALPTIPVT
ncbi:MAG: hypothetical protein ACREBU_26020 [Nitrososphaera sp.]